MDEQEAQDLLKRYEANQCSGLEKAAVESWLLHRFKTVKLPEGDIDRAALEREIWANIAPKPLRRRLPAALGYVAVIAALLGISIAFYHHNTETKTQIAKEILPGGNNATLTLANGTKIDLKNIHSGEVTNTAGAVITNDTSKGVVIYKSSNSNHTAQTDINTITTPSGGQYKLILPDGSSVLLNASSSLQFPSHFATHLRKVTLIGEAYFEVAKNPKQPFQVETKGQQLTVLGTHFDISAYPDETIKTTLSEGSVQLTHSSSLKKQILQPEQQATLTDNGFDLKSVNSAEEMAWKDGLFTFRKTPISDVLHQLCRWYNVEADYTNLPNTSINADLSRTATLQEIITGLNFSNRSHGIKIQFIDGRRLIVSKAK